MAPVGGPGVNASSAEQHIAQPAPLHNRQPMSQHDWQPAPPHDWQPALPHDWQPAPPHDSQPALLHDWQPSSLQASQPTGQHGTNAATRLPHCCRQLRTQPVRQPGMDGQGGEQHPVKPASTVIAKGVNSIRFISHVSFLGVLVGILRRGTGSRAQQHANRPCPSAARPQALVSIRRTRHKLFVVTAFMRSYGETGRSGPMNRVTTNGFDECLQALDPDP